MLRLNLRLTATCSHYATTLRRSAILLRIHVHGARWLRNMLFWSIIVLLLFRSKFLRAHNMLRILWGNLLYHGRSCHRHRVMSSCGVAITVALFEFGQLNLRCVGTIYLCDSTLCLAHLHVALLCEHLLCCWFLLYTISSTALLLKCFDAIRRIYYS